MKHDALAAPAVLAHLEAAVNDTEEEEGGGTPSSGGVMWHKVLSELQLTYAHVCSRMLTYAPTYAAAGAERAAGDDSRASSALWQLTHADIC